MTRLLPLRSLALLLLLLPGLLLAGGGELHLCLHDLVAFEDGCIEQVAGPGPANCCDPAPGGPALAEHSQCGRCCIELSTQSELSARESSGQTARLALALDLPPRIEGLRTRDPAALSRPLPPSARPPSRPGRAPLPLRI